MTQRSDPWKSAPSSTAIPAVESPPSPPGVSSPVRPDARTRVLVIDDSQEARDLYGEVLGFNGLRVESADGGAAGLARAVAAPPDLVVLDFSMPGMNGGEVLRLLRADGRTRHIPVVMVTAAPELVGDEVRAVCAALLEKPCHLDTLLKTISRLVQ